MTIYTLLATSCFVVATNACKDHVDAGTSDNAPAAQNTAKPHLCFDRVLPSHLREEAGANARSENPRNSPVEATSDATMMRYKKWLPGRTLHVRFLEGDAAVIE